MKTLRLFILLSAVFSLEAFATIPITVQGVVRDSAGDLVIVHAPIGGIRAAFYHATYCNGPVNGDAAFTGCAPSGGAGSEVINPFNIFMGAFSVTITPQAGTLANMALSSSGWYVKLKGEFSFGAPVGEFLIPVNSVPFSNVAATSALVANTAASGNSIISAINNTAPTDTKIDADRLDIDGGSITTGTIAGNTVISTTGTISGAAIISGAGTAAAAGVQVGSNAGTGLYSSGAHQLNFTTNGVQRMSIDSIGNSGFGASSTGARLHARGNGTNPIMRFEDSTGTKGWTTTADGRGLMPIENGQGYIGSNDYPLANVSTAKISGGASSHFSMGFIQGGFTGYFDIGQNFDWNGMPGTWMFKTGAFSNTATTGNGAFVLTQGTFAPTSGTAGYSSIGISDTINQTGGASGITRGLYINPSITAAADWRGIEVLTGTASGKGIVVRGAASQSDNLQEWQNSTGTVLSQIDSAGFLTIGSGSFVGDFTNPAIKLGTGNGIYVDSNRLFFVAGGSFAGGFAPNGFTGNSVLINTVDGNSSFTTPKFIPYRLTPEGLLSGMGGNSLGDLSLITDGNSRLSILNNGNVGIGTTEPRAKLSVENGHLLVRNHANVVGNSGTLIASSINVGSISTFGVAIKTITESSDDNTYGMQFFTQENFATSITEKMRIQGNGNVGIGIASPNEKLEVNGNIRITGYNGGGLTTAQIDHNGNIIRDASDKRLKTDIQEIESPLTKILSMKGVSYKWKDNRSGGKRDVGFIAQDLEKIVPEVVSESKDKEKLKAVNYGHLIAVVVEGLKEFYMQFKGVEKDVAIIKTQLKDASRVPASVQVNKELTADVARLKSENARKDQEISALKNYLCAKDPTAPFCSKKQ